MRSQRDILTSSFPSSWRKEEICKYGIHPFGFEMVKSRKTKSMDCCYPINWLKDGTRRSCKESHASSDPWAISKQLTSGTCLCRVLSLVADLDLWIIVAAFEHVKKINHFSSFISSLSFIFLSIVLPIDKFTQLLLHSLHVIRITPLFNRQSVVSKKIDEQRWSSRIALISVNMSLSFIGLMT